MAKLIIEILNLLAIVAVVCIPFFKPKGKGIITLGIITLQTIIGFILAFSIFKNGSVEYSYPGSWITGPIPIRIDFLAAWFIIVIGFTFFTGTWYGLHYMKNYVNQPYNLTLHAVALILAYTALIDICIVQNSLVMLVMWEIMTLASFILIIFEHQKTETIKAGSNFLIQSHIGILFLTVAFIWVKIKTGTYDFQAIQAFTSVHKGLTGLILFLFFFFGFGIKAGFVPFHTWLPLAHPAAPAHISGIMSGVIIKIGIFGIFRIIMLIKTDMAAIGYFILIISVITGVYGVMLAIIQHNLKRLLAYHSIENIGIIGIGIGLGCIGLHNNNALLIISGFGGSLLHTLNHSLFKSLLFFSTGNVYLAEHTMNMDSMGGLLKRIPHSAFLFLIGSLAICGLPPFNGFVSEFFIYCGLFRGLLSTHFITILFMLFIILGLVLIGGLALICFTKAFGIVFLGNSRRQEKQHIAHETIHQNLSLYLIVFAILIIGIFPIIFRVPLMKITGSISPETISTGALLQSGEWFNTLTSIGWYSLLFIALCMSVFFIRYIVTRNRQITSDMTWGCGYIGETAKTQYTASSYIRSYRKLVEPILLIRKKKNDAAGLYPKKIEQHTHPEDKIELWFIDKPVFMIKRLLNRFVFLQNGNIQAYVIYGLIFIGLAVILPLLIEKILLVIQFINQL